MIRKHWCQTRTSFSYMDVANQASIRGIKMPIREKQKPRIASQEAGKVKQVESMRLSKCVQRKEVTQLQCCEQSNCQICWHTSVDREQQSIKQGVDSICRAPPMVSAAGAQCLAGIGLAAASHLSRGHCRVLRGVLPPWQGRSRGQSLSLHLAL